MSSVIRWSPVDELVTLRDAMDRLVEDTFARPWRREGAWAAGLPIDMYETRDAVVLKTRLPGVKPEDLELTIHGDSLTIKAELGKDVTDEDAKNRNWYRRELFHGSVGASITLPTMVQADKAEATFHNGELTLTLPKAEEVKPRTIKVKAVK